MFIKLQTKIITFLYQYYCKRQTILFRFFKNCFPHKIIAILAGTKLLIEDYLKLYLINLRRLEKCVIILLQSNQLLEFTKAIFNTFVNEIFDCFYLLLISNPIMKYILFIMR